MKKLLVVLTACFLSFGPVAFGMHGCFSVKKTEKHTVCDEPTLNKKLVKDLGKEIKSIFQCGFRDGYTSGVWFVGKMNDAFSDYYEKHAQEIYQALDQVFQKNRKYKEKLDKFNMLHAAIKLDYCVTFIWVLLKLGANTLKKDLFGKLPIDYASEREDARVICKLIDPERHVSVCHVVEEITFDENGEAMERKEIVQDPTFDFNEAFGLNAMVNGLALSDSDEE
ncbi:MAG: hypothetical protein ABH827_02005 [bacterium]